jgi:predicted DNA-binding transcriptional regulator AlpA
MMDNKLSIKAEPQNIASLIRQLAVAIVELTALRSDVRIVGATSQSAYIQISSDSIAELSTDVMTRAARVTSLAAELAVANNQAVKAIAAMLDGQNEDGRYAAELQLEAMGVAPPEPGTYEHLMHPIDGEPDDTSSVSVHEVARMAGVSSKTITRMVDRGEMPTPHKVAGRITFHWRDVKGTVRATRRAHGIRQPRPSLPLRGR